MRRLAILAVLAALALPAWCVPTVTQWTPYVQCDGCSTGGTATATFGSNVASGDIIVAFEGDGATTNVSFSGAGCSAVTATAYAAPNSATAYVSTATSGGPCSVTGTAPANGTYFILVAADITGSNGTVDGSGTHSCCPASPLSMSFTMAQSGDLAVGFGWVTNGTGAAAPSPSTAGFTAGPLHNSFEYAGTAYGAQSSGTVTLTFSEATAQTNEAGVVVALESGGAGPPACPPTLMTLGVGCG